MANETVAHIRHQKKLQDAKEKIVVAIIRHGILSEAELLRLGPEATRRYQAHFVALFKKRSRRRWMVFNAIAFTGIALTVMAHWNILSVPKFLEVTMYLLAMPLFMCNVLMETVPLGKLEPLKFLYYDHLLEAGDTLTKEYGQDYLYTMLHEGEKK